MYSELGEVLRYISSKVNESGIITLYRELSNLYEQARNSPSAEITAQIEEKWNQLRNAQLEIAPENWDSIKIKTFEKIGASSLLGKEGLVNLEEEITKLTNDPHGVSEIINKSASSIEGLKQKVEQSLSSLEPLFGEAEQLPENLKRIEIVFDKKVSVENFEDIEQSAHDWDVILKNFQLIIPEHGDKVKVQKIYKLSPAVIVIVAIPSLILLLARVTKEVLDIIEKLWTIRKLKSETKAADLDGELKKKMMKNLDTAEEKKLAELVEMKVKNVVNPFRGKLTKTQINEAENATRYNIKKIYNFTIQGGNVNLIDGQLGEGEETITQSQFSPIYAKTRSLFSQKAESLLLASFAPDEEEGAERRIEEELLKKEKEPPKSIGAEKKMSKSQKTEPEVKQSAAGQKNNK